MRSGYHINNICCTYFVNIFFVLHFEIALKINISNKSAKISIFGTPDNIYILFLRNSEGLGSFCSIFSVSAYTNFTSILEHPESTLPGVRFSKTSSETPDTSNGIVVTCNFLKREPIFGIFT